MIGSTHENFDTGKRKSSDASSFGQSCSEHGASSCCNERPEVLLGVLEISIFSRPSKTHPISASHVGVGCGNYDSKEAVGVQQSPLPSTAISACDIIRGLSWGPT
jgi:hypothetical protein